VSNITEKPNRVGRLAVAMSCVALLGIGLASVTLADTWDKKTIVTFNTPVEVPGKVLPAGTYVLKLLDSASNRHIVQIFDKDEKQLLATILAIPDYRLQPAGETVLYFEERPAGSPPALKAWFYPGDLYGQHFVYPETRASELAKQNKTNVLSMSDEMTKNMAAPSTSAKDQSVQQLQKTEVTGVNPAGDQVLLEVVIATKPEK
jgi:hypothetical protein